MLAKSTGGAMVKAGGSSWFFITADYTFGHTLERETTAFITAEGGKVVGSLSYPFPQTTDFSSQLLQAQTSGAKVIGLASAGVDTSNQVKQARMSSASCNPASSWPGCWPSSRTCTQSGSDRPPKAST